MAESKTKKVKKKKIKISGIIIILILIILIYLFVSTITNLPIKHIYITGTNYTTDNEIINKCEIKYYPAIYRLNIRELENKIEELPLISDANIERNIFGKLTIEVKEENILFLNKSQNKLVLSNMETIDNTKTYYQVPTLINFVPDTIYNDLISGLSKVDYDILRAISEIEYSPSTNNEGASIDETRFYLRMNDGNAVYMNTVNIKRLNSYYTIYASLTDENGKGTLYLDSISEEHIYFKSYALEKEEQNAKDSEVSNGTNTEN